MDVRENPIVIVGCGPGGRDYIIPLAQRAMFCAELLVGSPRLLDLYPELTAERVTVSADLEPALTAIGQASSRRVVVMVTGDPGVASFARVVIERFGGARCRVIPGISAVQLAFARLGLEWTGLRMVNAHGCIPSAPRLNSARQGPVAVLTDGRPQSWDWTVRFVGESTGAKVAVCEDLGMETERIRWCSPKTLADLTTSSRTIVILPEPEVQK